MPGRTAESGPPAAPEPASEAAPKSWMERPSKTRMKQASHELQELGEALVDFSDAKLEPLDLGEPLLDAIRACRSIRSHEARPGRCS